MSNSNQPGLLPNLYSKVYALRDFMRDSFYTKMVANFRVLCRNRMLEIGPRPDDMSYAKASSLATLWGKDPVHPSAAAYKKMPDAVLGDPQDAEARDTNPPRKPADCAAERPSTVPTGLVGCSTALPRKDAATKCGKTGSSSLRGAARRQRGRGLFRGCQRPSTTR
jgi:hypothetical protein